MYYRVGWLDVYYPLANEVHIQRMTQKRDDKCTCVAAYFCKINKLKWGACAYPQLTCKKMRWPSG